MEGREEVEYFILPPPLILLLLSILLQDLLSPS